VTRYLIAALVSLAVIAAIGYVVRDRWFGSSGPAASITQPVPVPITPIHEPAGSAAEAPSALVVEMKGRVEKRAGTVWLEVRAGDRLTTQDTIRTAEGASATIDVGAPVLVDDRTEITIGEISKTVSPLVLSEGRVSAHAGARGGPTIRISTRDTDVVAETAAGQFDVLSSGKGHVTVAAAEGEVKVSAGGKTVGVRAGEYSTVMAGAVPSAPAKVPTSLFLKVSAAGNARDKAALQGETTPGAIVSINGVRSAPDGKGRFTGEVPLVKGANVIVVLVEDAMGRKERKVIKRDVGAPKSPKLNTQVEWK